MSPTDENWNLNLSRSFLNLTEGMLKLWLVQASSGRRLVGTRLALQSDKITGDPSEYEIQDCRDLLAATAPKSLTVISYHPGLRACEADLEELSRSRTIVGLGGNYGNGTNIAYIATGGKLHRKAKLSLSSEDRSFGLKPGTELTVFDSVASQMDSPVRWTVLNCHDYTHADLLKVIQATKVELIVVVTYNAATRLFWEYATADIHRLFCYVVVVNVAELGGSGVFGPFRQIGNEENAGLSMGGQLFGAKGPGSLKVTLSLPIQELRDLRDRFSREGFDAGRIHAAGFGAYQPIMPPEHFLATVDRDAGPPVVDRVLNHEIDWNFCAPRVAVAQLRSMEQGTYLATKYRIRNHKDSPKFERLLSVQLSELETRCSDQGPTESGTLLDLLVLPEVFVPRDYIPILQEFSNRVGSLVICGVDYPGETEEENANDCVIIRPGADPIGYRKISRSQYDAVRPNGARMPMRRGRELVRLVNKAGRGMGVLICSDYSHYDLMWALNLQDRTEPLDLTVVIAHNPFVSLYHSCCIADSHRFYQFILMCNVMPYGGSGVFGPQRTKGARQVLAHIGQGVEGIVMVSLPLDDLASARQSEDAQLHTGRFMRKPGVFQSRWLNPVQGK